MNAFNKNLQNSAHTTAKPPKPVINIPSHQEQLLSVYNENWLIYNRLNSLLDHVVELMREEDFDKNFLAEQLVAIAGEVVSQKMWEYTDICVAMKEKIELEKANKQQIH